MLNAIGDAFSGAADAVANAADAVVEGVKDAGMAAACKLAEVEIRGYLEKYAETKGDEIEVDVEDIPDHWKTWIMYTGINSLATDDSWEFLATPRKRELWKERGIKKIVMTVKENVEKEDRWIPAWGEWNEGDTTLKIIWYPRAKEWESSRMWNEQGYKRWWILEDKIVFFLRLYQLPGKCFYKSDWLEDFEDVDPDGFLPSSTHKVKRWFQFRHWIMYWYPNAMFGYNWAWTTKPPKNDDGTDFDLSKLLKLPSMPDLSLPEIKLPSLPDIEMPSIEMPSIEMPSVSMPSMPSLSAPSLSMPSIPEKPKRPPGKWDCHGYIELPDMKCIAKGQKLVLSNAKITHFWDKDGHTDLETKEHQRLELTCTSDEQAASWVETLKGSGVEEGEVGGCCAVA